MNAQSARQNRISAPALFSTIWIFAVANYLYCDVMTLMDSSFLKQFLQGNVGGVATTPAFFLAAAILMEISMSMILLSRILPFAACKWANLLAGAFTTLVQISTLFVGAMPPVYYIFFSVMEIGATASIAVLAWRWKKSAE